jgi:SOS-response transcriptional repressor LexA
VRARRDIGVALFDGEATIKQLQRGPGYWTLKPHSTNSDHQPIVAESEF